MGMTQVISGGHIRLPFAVAFKGVLILGDVATFVAFHLTGVVTKSETDLAI